MASSEETKVALVTGSSSGIGAATVKLFAQKGYNVVVCGYEPELVEQVAEECTRLSPKGLKPLALTLDLSNPENCKMVVSKTVEQFGRLDVLINSVGIFAKTDGQDSASYGAYRRVMAINTDTTVCLSLAAVEHLKKTRGNMVFVSSVSSRCSAMHAYAYGMSKAAITSFAKNLAFDVSPHVRVNVVSPGPILTTIFEQIGLTPDAASSIYSNTTLLQRMGATDDVAAAIYFLASDDASFIQGHELVVDGGFQLAGKQNVSANTIAEHKTDA